MKHPPTDIRKHSGIALVALLVMLVLAGSYALYRGANIRTSAQGARDKQLQQLILAKQALIAYAVTDLKRPGRLLCPNLSGDGISPLLTRDDCDSYSGFLPWKSLDLSEGTDSTGTMLLYHLSPLFGGDRSTPVLNSDTETSLKLDIPEGSPSNGIAALIIAPRGSIDPRNADGNEYFYIGTSDLPGDDDLIISITRQELMAATELRIANEIRNCLAQHAASAENVEHTYPWPAPLVSESYAGLTGSLFGRLPLTQSGNPDEALKKSNATLGRLRDQLANASTPDSQLAVLVELNNATAYAKSLYDSLYIAAKDLQEKSLSTKNSFGELDSEIVAATANSSAFNAQASNLPTAIQSRLPSLNALSKSLSNLGLDIFSMEAALQNSVLLFRIGNAQSAPSSLTLGALQSQDNVFQNKLFAFSTTPNYEISTVLSASMLASGTAAENAKQAKTQPENGEQVNRAIGSARTLQLITEELLKLIENNRISQDGQEYNFLSQRILNAWTESSSTESDYGTLISALERASTQIATLSTANSIITMAKSNAQGSVLLALSATHPPVEQTSLQSATLAAISSLDALASSLSNNGDNVALESLKFANNTLTVSSQSTPTSITAGQALRQPTKAVIYWADIAENHASDVARLARKGSTATYENNSSAYSAAKKLLSTLDGENGSIYLLQQYIANETPANKLAAQTAIGNAKISLDNLLDKANTLDDLLETSWANAAVPTNWQGSACSSFMTDSWWKTNQWERFFFYQIGDRNSSAPGKLIVNGRGNYKIVVLSAGTSLPGQDRSIRETRNYLEGLNQDTSRDGEAKTPVTRFTSIPASPSFNDRLAY